MSIGIKRQLYHLLTQVLITFAASLFTPEEAYGRGKNKEKSY